MGLTIGLKASINHPHLESMIKSLIDNEVQEQNYLLVCLDQEKVTSEDINDYINKINNPVVDDMIMVGIIPNFDKLSIINQNKLLKTIEDNKKQIQILIFEHEHSVLETILSRIVTYALPDKISTDDEFLKIFEPNLYYWLVNNEELATIYRQIYKYALQGRFAECFVIFKTKIDQVNLIDVEIMQTIFLTALFTLQDFIMYKRIQAYENKNRLKITYPLLVDAMFSEVLMQYK